MGLDKLCVDRLGKELAEMLDGQICFGKIEF
jgi:hypothetical protein